MKNNSESESEDYDSYFDSYSSEDVWHKRWGDDLLWDMDPWNEMEESNVAVFICVNKTNPLQCNNGAGEGSLEDTIADRLFELGLEDWKTEICAREIKNTSRENETKWFSGMSPDCNITVKCREDNENQTNGDVKWVNSIQDLFKNFRENFTDERCFRLSPNWNVSVTNETKVSDIPKGQENKNEKQDKKHQNNNKEETGRKTMKNEAKKTKDELKMGKKNGNGGTAEAKKTKDERKIGKKNAKTGKEEANDKKKKMGKKKLKSVKNRKAEKKRRRASPLKILHGSMSLNGVTSHRNRN